MKRDVDFHAHYGFHVTPFTREIPVDQHYALALYEDAVTALVRVVEQRESALLLAPAGTGKTNVLRALKARLPEARYRVSYLKVTSLSKREFCRELALALGAPPAGSYPALVRRLEERLTALTDTDALRPVVLVDDAHDLRLDVLAILRTLTNFEMDSRLVVSILLAGQPPLREMLRRDDLEDVARRLAHIAALRPLSRDEMRAYVAHRVAIAGAATVPFDPGALEAIFEIGRGNLRATDRLALKALELAHQGGAAVADHNHVTQARPLLWP